VGYFGHTLFHNEGVVDHKLSCHFYDWVLHNYVLGESTRTALCKFEGVYLHNMLCPFVHPLYILWSLHY
jgi:hypothetical protein